MPAVIVDAEMRNKLKDAVAPVEVRDAQGILMGQYVPDQTFLNAAQREIMKQFPRVTAEEKEAAWQAYERGEYLTGEQMIEQLEAAHREWESRK